MTDKIVYAFRALTVLTDSANLLTARFHRRRHQRIRRGRNQHGRGIIQLLILSERTGRRQSIIAQVLIDIRGRCLSRGRRRMRLRSLQIHRLRRIGTGRRLAQTVMIRILGILRPALADLIQLERTVQTGGGGGLLQLLRRGIVHDGRR